MVSDAISLSAHRFIEVEERTTHPSTQDSQRVDSVEALTPSVDLRNGERSSLRWSNRTGRERDPVDLSLHDSSDGSMLLWAE